MTRTPEAIIEHTLLVWARVNTGLTVEEAAGKIGVPVDRLERWEAGEERLSIAQLRKVAVVYKRPLAVFYLSEPPRDFQPLRDFRRLPAAEGGLSPELRAAIRRAHTQREVALELRAVADEPVKDAPRIKPVPKDPEEFAALARGLLGVGLETQYDWTDAGRALNGWIAAMEDLDVLVFQTQRIALGEMRGFSITAPKLPVVVLNGGDAARARIFTLLHEFVHVLIATAGVCDLQERRDVGATDDVEVFCNRVAAATLLPAEVFLREPRVAAAPSSGRWADDTLRTLSERYSVSQEVILRRLYSLGLTNWDFLQEKTGEYQLAYEEHRERGAAKPGRPGYYRMRVRDLGRPLIRLALDAYYRDDINASELAGYLEVKLNKLPQLEKELVQAEARG